MSNTATTARPALIASANTRNGFAIGVTRTLGQDARTYFSVVRMDRASRFVTISIHGDEAAARQRANVEYRADR